MSQAPDLPEPPASFPALRPVRARIVLVQTTYPGNLGSCARAMLTMGFDELVLVNPPAFLEDVQARSMAVGAWPVLEQARICRTLPEALEDCVRAYAWTARVRDVSVAFSTPRAVAQHVVAARYEGPIAFVFGSERTGLTNEDLEHCNEAVEIPTNPAYRSLNLAAAVQLACYELRMAQLGEAGLVREEKQRHEPVGQAAMEHLYAHLERVLVATNFLQEGEPRHVMRKLRKLFGRAAPSRNEMSILRGMLAGVERRMAAAAGGGAGGEEQKSETRMDTDGTRTDTESG